ncbi:MAG: hypothetical protein J0H94_12910 [Rhizobiales bacterium]|nr:hypothetical protein [Hyphomicrobiales bacterium]
MIKKIGAIHKPGAAERTTSMVRHFDLVLSLGPNCRAKHQLARIYGEAVSPSAVFDWQITPRRALHAYLRNRFRGMFEYEDLTIKDGMVHAGRGANHMHAFPADITMETLPAHYGEARSRHEYLAEKTLRMFLGKQKLLLCLAVPVSLYDHVRLWAVIRRNYPRLKFMLLNGPRGDLPADSEHWKGDDAVWDRHLKSFLPRPPSLSPAPASP